MSYSQAAVKPEGTALVLHSLPQTRSRSPNFFIGPLPCENPLIQTAGGQDVFLIDPTERQTEGEQSK